MRAPPLLLAQDRRLVGLGATRPARTASAIARSAVGHTSGCASRHPAPAAATDMRRREPAEAREIARSPAPQGARRRLRGAASVEGGYFRALAPSIAGSRSAVRIRIAALVTATRPVMQ